MKNKIFVNNIGVKKERLGEKFPQVCLFEKKNKNSKLVHGFQPKKDLSRFVKWPKYIQIQRERKILFQQLKIPLMISRFSRSLDVNLTKTLITILSNYSKKTKISSKYDKKNVYLKFGINLVTNLIQKKNALFVVIASDVDPIETVVWLPALCQRMNIPYCLIKSKSVLGQLVNKKNTSCVALTSVLDKDKKNVEKMIECFRSNFNKKCEENKK